MRWCPALLVAVCGCAPQEELPPGHCRATIWAQPERAGGRVDVVGSWDGWERSASLRRFDATWHVAELALPPGSYGYQLIEEGRGRVDAFNPLSTWRETDGHEVSLLDVADCSVPHVEVESVAHAADGSVSIALAWTGSQAQAPPDPASLAVTGAPGDVKLDVQDEALLHVRVSGLGPGKHRWEIALADDDGRNTPPQRAAAFVGARASERADEIIYQVLIDRFRADGGHPLQPPPNPGARAGGTLDGVRAELEAGTFDALAVSTLWLSPVYTNPVEAREGSDGQLYEGYHGYWALDSRGVDPRIGGETALRALVEAAHARGIRVVLDLVPNHLYEANPRVAQRWGEGWFHEHDPPCVCGTPSCPWSRFIHDCWFTPYLPDLRFETPGVVESVVADALWWQETFDIDGFRIDAVPMMPRAVTRRIVHAIRAAEGPDAAFSVGEIFTGAGATGTETIRFYLGPDGLDSAFDFPLMWALRDVVGRGVSGFEAVEASIAYRERALQGSGSLPSLIVGNHDTTRFVSVAHGDDGRDPWGAQPAEQPTTDDAYVRHTLALGLALTLPGIPTIYYGDEVGLAGGGDPDSRRVFPAAGDVSAAQAQVQDTTRALAQLRRCMPALRRGVRAPLVVSEHGYAFARVHDDGEPAIVIASIATEPTAIALPPSAPQGGFVDALTGETIAVGTAGAPVPMAPLSLRVLVPQGHRCVL